MSIPRPLVTGLARLLCAVALLALVPVGGAAGHAQGDPAATAAVAALTTQPARAASTQLPPDFPAVAGYTPAVAAGRLLRPDGGCSSPVPLPRAFEPACREHDLGYDLLRYAAAAGNPLGVSARRALDQHFARRLEAVCDARTGAHRAWCQAQAWLAGTGVRLNSMRQRDGSPDGSVATTAVSVAAGAVLLLPVRRRSLARARTLLDQHAPPRSTTVALTAAVGVSLLPSLLPRPPALQGLVTGVLATLALGLVALAQRHRDSPPHADGEPERTCRGRELALAVAVFAGAVAVGHTSQLRLAESTGTPSPGAAHWVQALLVAVATGLALTLLGRGVARLARWSARRTSALRLAALALAAAVSVAAAGPGAGGFTRLLDQPLDADHVMLARSPVGATRVYVSLEEASGPAAAELAARRLAAAGGLRHRAVVVVVPTGSGWVNPAAVEGLEQDLGGDVATVAVQYDRSPSWLAMLTARDTAEASATEVLRAVADRLARRPPSQRPDLYLLGESLGALAGQAAVASYDATPGTPVPVCGALWAGAPGGGRPAAPGERVLSHADDPVVHLDVAALRHRPDGWGGPLWLPLASYGGLLLDLPVALDVPAGHGHRYGAEEDWSLPRCR